MSKFYKTIETTRTHCQQAIDRMVHQQGMPKLNISPNTTFVEDDFFTLYTKEAGGVELTIYVKDAVSSVKYRGAGDSFVTLDCPTYQQAVTAFIFASYQCAYVNERLKEITG